MHKQTVLPSIYYLLILLTILFGGQAGRAQESWSREALQAVSVPDLERLLLNTDDPTGEQQEVIRAVLLEKLRMRLMLSIRNAVYAAADIYVCQTLDGEQNLECRFTEADDTIHTTEFPEHYIAVPFPIPYADEQEGIQVIASPEIARETLRFYRGDPAVMHQSGYQTVTSVALSPDGRLALKPDQFERAQVLFVIVGVRDEPFLTKYVWVLGDML